MYYNKRYCLVIGREAARLSNEMAEPRHMTYDVTVPAIGVHMTQVRDSPSSAGCLADSQTKVGNILQEGDVL